MTDSTPSDFWRKLLHRWLVQYNPMYLASAALVLGGVMLLSRGLAADGNAVVQVSVGGVAEVYAWSLIAGAAILMRCNLPRPAVMLALLCVLYQGDLTLHTDTSVYLGVPGMVGTTLWLASSVAKLYALGWAMRLALPRSGIAIASTGALGLALIPRCLALLDHRAMAELIGVWVFSLFAARLWSEPRVSSHQPLDDWGRTVVRRALRAAWLIWAVLLLCHVAFWWKEYSLAPTWLLPVSCLLATRWLRSEAKVWLVVAGTLLLVAFALPSLFSMTAWMAVITFALFARRQPRVVEIRRGPPPDVGPYRLAASTPPFARIEREVVFVRATGAALSRLATGMLFGVHLALWTRSFRGGAWPDHELWLDLALGAIVLAMVFGYRIRAALAPLVALYAHGAIRADLVPLPESVLGWGAASVGLGFSLLFASIATSIWLSGTEKELSVFKRRARL